MVSWLALLLQPYILCSYILLLLIILLLSICLFICLFDIKKHLCLFFRCLLPALLSTFFTNNLARPTSFSPVRSFFSLIFIHPLTNHNLSLSLLSASISLHIYVCRQVRRLGLRERSLSWLRSKSRKLERLSICSILTDQVNFYLIYFYLFTYLFTSLIVSPRQD